MIKTNVFWLDIPFMLPYGDFTFAFALLGTTSLFCKATVFDIAVNIMFEEQFIECKCKTI